jgi:hypothetical protein
MTEQTSVIDRQGVPARIGGIPRVSRPDSTSGIKATLEPLFTGIMGAITTADNEKKAKFAFSLRNKLNQASITKNQLEVANLRDKLINAEGPDGSGLLTPEDMREAQKMKPEFTFNRKIDQATGDTIVYDADNNIIQRIKAAPPETGDTEAHLERVTRGLNYVQEKMPNFSNTLNAQLINPHDPKNGGDVVKFKALGDAGVELGGEVSRVIEVIESAITLHHIRTGKEMSILDITNRGEFNRDKLFEAVEAFSLQLEAINRYSQAGIGGPAQIAPISVFNAFKGDLYKMLITPEATAAYGGLKEVRTFMDLLEADIDKAATDAFTLGTDRTALVESQTIAETYKAEREIRHAAIRNTWTPEFAKAALESKGMAAIATTIKVLKETGQQFAAGRMAEIIAEQATGTAYDMAIRTINSFSTPNPEEAVEIYSAAKILRDSLLSSFDAPRMRRAKKAIDGLLANKNIDWSRNPAAKEAIEYLQDKVFSGSNMARAESIIPGVSALRKARNP